VSADFDVVAYLAAKGHRGRPAGANEVAYPCFFGCEEATDSRKRKLYVNPDEGVYYCFVCGASGGTYTLQRHFGDDPKVGTTDDAFVRRRILDWAAQTGQDMLDNNDDALLYLINDRGLEPDTIMERKLGFVGNGWSLTGSLPEQFTREQLLTTGLVYRDGDRKGKDFFWRHLLIPYVSRGHVIQMRGRAWGEHKGGKYMTGPGEPVRLYNADALEDAEEVIVTEGEFDCIVLAQHLKNSPEERARRIAVVGLPGIQSLPDDLEAALAHVKRIFIGFDSDDAGKAGAEKIKEKLGNRARIISLPYEDSRKCDWTEYLLPKPDGAGKSWDIEHPYAGHGYRDVLRLMGAAAGKRIFSVAEAGMAFREYRAVNDGIKTGFAQMDQAILPGLLPGQVVIFLAKTGAGKTVFMCNLAFNMRQHRVLFISLEMTREEVYDRLRRIFLFHNPRATDAEVDFGLENVYICDENRLGEKDIGLLVAEFEVEAGHRPDVVIVDYLGYYARGAKGNTPYEKAGNAVMQLKADAKAGRFVIISPSQVSRVAKEGKPIDLDDARDAGTIEETADFMFSLYRPDDAMQVEGVVNQQPTGKVKCGVLKSRHGNKGRQFSFQMDLLTLAVVDDQTELAKKAVEHNYLVWRGHTWDDLRRMETAPTQRFIPGVGAR